MGIFGIMFAQQEQRKELGGGSQDHQKNEGGCVPVWGVKNLDGWGECRCPEFQEAQLQTTGNPFILL
jgi:hypothetical protein